MLNHPISSRKVKYTLFKSAYIILNKSVVHIKMDKALLYQKAFCKNLCVAVIHYAPLKKDQNWYCRAFTNGKAKEM